MNKADKSNRESLSNTFSYYGNLPQNGIFLTYSSKTDDFINDCLYLNALEIALNGYDVIYVQGSKAASSIEKGCIDGKGKLYCVLPFGLKHIYYSKIPLVLDTGGGIIMPFSDEDRYSYRGLNVANIIATHLSSALVIGDDFCTFKSMSHIRLALDSAKDIAILKIALKSQSLRELAKEGCPVIDSFSSFLPFPKAIAYTSDNGIYGKNRPVFDIIFLDER